MIDSLNRLAVAAALACAALGSHATVLPYKDFRQLVQEADGIVVGTVRAVQVAGQPAGDLHTFVTVEPQEVISGRVEGATLTLRLKGGFDGQRGLHIDGVPSFSPEERVLLFVRDNGRELVPFVGWGQGVFRLQRDEQGGTERVVDADGRAVVGLRGTHVLRDESEHAGDTHVLGAPSLATVRGQRPQGSVGSTDDGSVARLESVTQGALPAMQAERFLERVRAAVTGSGRTLASVLPGSDTRLGDGRAERSSQRVAPAAYLGDRSGEAGVREPMRRPVAPAADER